MKSISVSLIIIIAIAGCSKKNDCPFIGLPPSSSEEMKAYLDTSDNTFSISCSYSYISSPITTRIVFPKVKNEIGKQKLQYIAGTSSTYDTLINPYLYDIKDNRITETNYLCHGDSSWIDIQEIDFANRKIEGVFFISMIKDSLFPIDSTFSHTRRIGSILKADILVR